MENDIITPEEIKKLSKQEQIKRIAYSHYRAFKISDVCHDAFTSMNNILNDVAKGYAGREILELLQNADDAYTKYVNMGGTPESDVGVLFEYDDDILEVSNKGTPFDFEAFSSICDGYKSPKKDKYDDNGYIGNKGIGFRSVLNWADSISIYSDGYYVGFSKEYAQKKFKELNSESTYVKDICERNPSLSYPIFSAPVWLNAGYVKEGYCTTIKLQLNGVNVQDSIKNFDAFSLLFMQHITSVRFKGNDSDVTYKKIERHENDFKIFDIYENDILKRSFYFFSESLNNYIQKKAVAIPVDFGKIENAKMYTFFPINNNNSPFKALLHATFELDPTRNSITKIDKNLSTFEELLKYYVETVCTHFAKKEFGNRVVDLLMIDNDDAIRQVNPNWYEKISLFYKEKCKDNIQLFTVNGDFIKVKDNPVLNYKREASWRRSYEAKRGVECLGFYYPEHFKKDNLDYPTTWLDKLLSPLPIRENDFLKELGVTTTYLSKEGNFNNLYLLLQAMEKRCSAQENCESFVFWCEEYAKKQSKKKTTLVWPNLLKTQNGEFAHGEIFFQDDDVTDALPDLAGDPIPILDGEYATCLKQIVKNKLEVAYPNVTTWYQCFQFHFKNDFLRPYNYFEIAKYLKRNVSLPTRLYIKWILANYDKIKKDSGSTEDKFVKEIISRLPDAAGRSQELPLLYMSEEMGNELGAQIFKALPVYHKIAPLSFFDIEDSQLESLKRLLNNAGIHQFPPSFSDGGEENWKDAFSNLDTEILFQWINNDENLYSEIQKKFFPYFGAEIKDIKWIKIGNGKFTTTQCLYIGNRETELPKYYPGCISEKWLRNIASIAGMKLDVIRGLLITLGMKESLKDLESQDFYQLLLNLQTSGNEQAKPILKRIYGEIADGSASSLLTQDSSARTKFKSDGLILTKDGSLLPHSKVFYANTQVLNLAGDPLINLQLRKNTSTVKDVFFVEPFQERYKVVPNENKQVWFKDAFLDDIKCWAVYIYCLRRRKNSDGDRGTLKKFYKSICLVDQISVSFDNGEPILIPGGFRLVEDQEGDKKWFICVGDVGGVPYEEFKSQNEVLIVEALMQLLSSALNLTDEHTLRQYADLFVRRTEYRKSILKAELNDDSQYESAKFELYGETAETTELLQKFSAAQIAVDDELEKLVKKLDFDKIESPSQEETIRKILQKLGMDLSTFNNQFGMAFSLVHANAKLLEHAFNIRHRYCELLIWKTLERSTDEEQSRYNQHLDELQRAIETEMAGLVDDLVEFDAAGYVEQFLKEKNLPVTFQEQDLENEVSVILKENKGALLEMSEEEQVYRFLSEGSNRSLLMFRQSSIKAKFSQWLENDKPEELQTPEEKGPKELPRKIIEITSGGGDVTPDAEVPEPQVIRVVQPRNSKGSTRNRRIVTEDGDENRDKGDDAELFVVNRLREKNVDAVNNFFAGEAYVVNWRSAASFRKENNVNCDDSVGYDIELVSETKKLFVEVKTSGDKGIRFFISENEYKTLKRNENYLILYIPNNHVLDNPEAEVEYVPIWSKDIEKYNPKPCKYLVLESLT